ncbi:MAG: hypothetical protein IJE16_05065 [Ruminococcus sp.]|nr:hypothetical protein [Ruminococcus sp.]
MNKFAVISNAVPQICEKLIELGFKLIYTENVDGFISYERTHADMQCLKIDDTIFILSGCKKLGKSLENIGYNVTYTKNKYSGSYPENILLNTKIIGKNLVGKINCLDETVISYSKKAGYNLIDVNQGYTACSCVKVSGNSVITADNSIYNALKNSEIDVLKISEGSIKLDGAGEKTYGFLGGASAMIDESTLLFFGDITKHPDYTHIDEFCSSKGVDIVYIEDFELTDIGGAILLNN